MTSLVGWHWAVSACLAPLLHGSAASFDRSRCVLQGLQRFCTSLLPPNSPCTHHVIICLQVHEPAFPKLHCLSLVFSMDLGSVS